MKWTFSLNKYNNTIDKVTVKSKDITINRKCRFVAKEYLSKKYIDTKEFDFIELKC